MQPLVLHCSCGIKYTLEGFRALPLKGYQDMTDGESPQRIEYRNCTCGSTRVIGTDLAGVWDGITSDK